MKSFIFKYLLGVTVIVGIVYMVRVELNQPYFKKFDGFDLKQLSKPIRTRGELFRYKVDRFDPTISQPSQYVEMIVSDIIGDSVYYNVRKEFSNGVSKITQYINDKNPMIEPYQEDTLVLQTYRVFQQIDRNMFPLNSLSSLEYQYIENNEYDGTSQAVMTDCKVQDSRPLVFDNFMKLPVVTIMCEIKSENYGYNKYYYYPPIGHWIKLERARAAKHGIELEIWNLIDYDSNREQFTDLFEENES